MKNQFLLVLGFILSTSIFAQTDSQFKDIEERINKILEITNTPGTAIAIVQGEKVIYTKGFGYKDYENKLKVDAATIFPIGSATKAFTAALLGQLQEKGTLTFENNPSQFLSALKFYSEELNENLIINDLLSMRTGLALHDGAWSGIPVTDRDSLLRRIEFLEPATHLRTKWNYSNFSYFILGAITEKLSGESWESNIEKALFKPLDMNGSSLGINGLRETSNVALGYNVSNNEIEKVAYYDLKAMGPAGDINSSTEDLGNWLITWINEGKYRGRQVLPELYVREAMSPQAVMPTGYLPDEEFNGRYAANYGYGWIISNYKGFYRVEHGGSIDGFRSTVVLFPNEKIGVVVLTNQTNYEPAMIIRNTIVDKFLDAKPTDWLALYLKNQEVEQATQSAKKTLTDPAPEIKISPKQIQQIAGNYVNPGYGGIKFFQEGNTLYTNFRGRKLKIVPTGSAENIFQARRIEYPFKTAMPALKFEKNSKGEISTLSINFESGIKPIEFIRE